MTADSHSPDGGPGDGAVAVRGGEPGWAVKVRELLNGRRLMERVKEAEAAEAAEELRKLALKEEDRVEEVAMEPQLLRVAPEAGAGVCDAPRGTATESGHLRPGDVVTVVGRKGQWLRIAEWEAVTGWVRDPAFEEGKAKLGQLQILVPAQGVPMELVHLRSRTARTEVLSWCEVTDRRLLAPLPGAGLGGVYGDAVYNYHWGIEARAEMATTALTPPGRAWHVYAARDFDAGEVVEACELLPAKDGASCHPSSILWPRTLCPLKGSRQAALPLGFGALYRRTMSSPEEANLEPQLEASDSWVSGSSTRPRMLLRAKRSIKLGEELTTAGDFLGAQGGLAWGDPASTQAGGHPLPTPCGARTSGQLQVRPSPVHGRGVFAERSFARGDVVELCPALVLDGPALSLFPDFAMSFDRPAEKAPPARPFRPPGAGNWDPLADPATGEESGEEEGYEPPEGRPPFAVKEKPGAAATQATEEAGEWDPLAEPNTETVTGNAMRQGAAAPPPPVPSTEWGDPFSDPAGKAEVVATPDESVVPRQRPGAPTSSSVMSLPATAAFPELAPGSTTIEDGEVIVMPLGFGALYNHAARGEGRNVRWAFAAARGMVVMMATRNVQQGEELFINYGREYWAAR